MIHQVRSAPGTVLVPAVGWRYGNWSDDFFLTTPIKVSNRSLKRLVNLSHCRFTVITSSCHNVVVLNRWLLCESFCWSVVAWSATESQKGRQIGANIRIILGWFPSGKLRACDGKWPYNVYRWSIYKTKIMSIALSMSLSEGKPSFHHFPMLLHWFSYDLPELTVIPCRLAPFGVSPCWASGPMAPSSLVASRRVLHG